MNKYAVRNFKIRIGNDKIDFLVDDLFLNDPSGLGFTNNVTTQRLGNSDLVTSTMVNYGIFSGELLFIGKREHVYAKYRETMRKLVDTTFTLEYYPADKADFYTQQTGWGFVCDAIITLVEKSEVSYRDSMLHVPIQISRLTPWRDGEQYLIRIDATSKPGKKYILNRPYHYGSNSLSKVAVMNYGNMESPFSFSIVGKCTNPTYSLYTSNDVLYGRGRILGTFDEVIVDAGDLYQNIRLFYEGSPIPNGINYQDLSVGDNREVYVTFLKVKPGENYAVFNLGTEFTGYVEAGWNNYYATV